MANFNAKEFQAIPVPKPPVALQRRFACIVASIERQRDQLLAQLPELDKLFGSLLSRAFSSELRPSPVLRRHASA
jgi:type I restriction enzyme S subunit